MSYKIIIFHFRDKNKCQENNELYEYLNMSFLKNKNQNIDICDLINKIIVDIIFIYIINSKEISMN